MPAADKPGELIGAVAERTGLTVETIRFYETEGLITPSRDAGGRRRYSPVDITGLEVVQALRNTGMGIKEIRQFATSVAPPAGGDGAERLTALRASMQDLLEVLDQREAELVRARSLVVRWTAELDQSHSASS